METILDSNFVIACVRNNIEFIEQLKLEGFRVIIPKEVLEEMKDLRQKVSRDERLAIDIGMDIISKSKIEKMKLPKGKVDEGLIQLGKKGAYIATLDKTIRSIVPNKIGISQAKNSILIERK